MRSVFALGLVSLTLATPGLCSISIDGDESENSVGGGAVESTDVDADEESAELDNGDSEAGDEQADEGEGDGESDAEEA